MEFIKVPSLFIHLLLYGVLFTVGNPSGDLAAKTIFKCSTNLTLDSFNVTQLITNGSTEVREVSSYNLIPREKPLECQGQRVSVYISYLIKDDHSEPNNSSRYILSANGYLRREHGKRISFIHPGNFCISNEGSEGVTADVCEFQCKDGTFAKGNVCVQKCCPDKKTLKENPYMRQLECAASSTGKSSLDFTFPGYSENQVKDLKTTNVEVLENVANLTGNLCSQKPMLYHFKESTEYYKFAESYEGISAGNNPNCVDILETEDGSSETVGLVCIAPAPTAAQQTQEPTGNYNYVYKCSPDVHESFIHIPAPLRMKYSKAKMMSFMTNHNYSSLFDLTLVEREPKCEGDTFTVTVPSTNTNYTKIGGKSQAAELSFTPDGYLVYIVKDLTGIKDPRDALADEIYFSRDNFCISSIDKDSISVKMCKSKCFHNDLEREENLCIPKCCFLGAVMTEYNPDRVGCAYTSNDDWMPDIFTNQITEENIPSMYPQFHWNYDGQIQSWNCGNDTIIETLHTRPEFRILSDGRILTRKPNKNYRVSWEEVYSGSGPVEFCIDGYWNKTNASDYDPLTARVIVTRCNISHTQDEERLNSSILRTQVLFFVTLLPCAIIHFATLFVYVSLWGHQNVHGWTVMGFSTSQLLLYVFLCILLGSLVFGDVAQSLLDLSNLCVSIGVLHHFFSISTFSWTTVMTFDVWAKISSMTVTSRSSKGKKRFLWYASIAVGIPLFVVSVACAMEFSFLMDRPGIIIPGYHDRCIISSPVPFLLYLGLTNTLLFTANLVFAGLTFKSLWDAKKNVDVLKKGNSSKANSFEKKTVLIGKLMLLMGFFLIFEFLFNYGQLLQFSVYFSILEIYKLFHALGVFWIFVCSKKTLKQLREKYPRMSILRRLHLKDKKIYSEASMDTRETVINNSTS